MSNRRLPERGVTMNGARVDLSMSRDEALLLFEMLFRYEQQGLLPQRNDAETRVLWNLMVYLEKSLREPFGAEYEELFLQARQTLFGEGKED
jgi:hypothetical protein